MIAAGLGEAETLDPARAGPDSGRSAAGGYDRPMPEMDRLTDPTTEETSLAALQAENLALKERLLAARDLLIGMELELGQALGERAVYERRVASLEATVHSRAWRAAFALLRPYRLLRR